MSSNSEHNFLNNSSTPSSSNDGYEKESSAIIDGVEETETKELSRLMDERTTDEINEEKETLMNHSRDRKLKQEVIPAPYPAGLNRETSEKTAGQFSTVMEEVMTANTFPSRSSDYSPIPQDEKEKPATNYQQEVMHKKEYLCSAIMPPTLEEDSEEEKPGNQPTQEKKEGHLLKDSSNEEISVCLGKVLKHDHHQPDVLPHEVLSNRSKGHADEDVLNGETRRGAHMPEIVLPTQPEDYFEVSHPKMKSKKAFSCDARAAPRVQEVLPETDPVLSSSSCRFLGERDKMTGDASDASQNYEKNNHSDRVEVIHNLDEESGMSENTTSEFSALTTEKRVVKHVDMETLNQPPEHPPTSKKTNKIIISHTSLVTDPNPNQKQLREDDNNDDNEEGNVEEIRKQFIPKFNLGRVLLIIFLCSAIFVGSYFGITRNSKAIQNQTPDPASVQTVFMSNTTEPSISATKDPTSSMPSVTRSPTKLPSVVSKSSLPSNLTSSLLEQNNITTHTQNNSQVSSETPSTLSPTMSLMPTTNNTSHTQNTSQVLSETTSTLSPTKAPTQSPTQPPSSSTPPTRAPTNLLSSPPTKSPTETCPAERKCTDGCFVSPSCGGVGACTCGGGTNPRNCGTGCCHYWGCHDPNCGYVSESHQLGDPCPTEAPTQSSTLFDFNISKEIWTKVVGEGLLYQSLVGDRLFREMVNKSANGIIYRLCTSCSATHQHIFYKRYTPYTEDRDYLDLFMNNWFEIDNKLNEDMCLFSTYEDALNDINCWEFCNYDDINIGFPRDCGPRGQVSSNWNSYKRSGGYAENHAFYVEA